jgi:hypothetical protein
MYTQHHLDTAVRSDRTPAERGSDAATRRTQHVTTGISKYRLQRREDPDGIPSRATLDGFVRLMSTNDGVNLTDIEPLTTLFVQTEDSVYRIIVSTNSNVFIQGGELFPATAYARLNGSGVGGNLLKLAWIGVGLCMEIYQGSRRITTSPVRAVYVEPFSSGIERSVH